MQAVFSLFLSKTFPRSALILLAIGLIGFGLSKSIFSITGLDPSRSATVNTTNCGSDTECDILLTVKDNKGKILVQKIYGGNSYDKASQLIQTPDGGYLILGSTSSFGNGNYDILLIKTNEMGLTIWEKTYGGFFNEYGEELALTSSSKSVTIEGTQQFCTTPNVSETCVQEKWKFEVDLEGNLIS